MQWTDGKNAGFSKASEDNLYLPVIKSDQFSYTKINVAMQQADPKSLFHQVRHLLALRKENPIMAEGCYEILFEEKYPALLTIKRSDGENTMLAFHNLSAKVIPIDLKIVEPEWKNFFDLVHGSLINNSKLELSPYAYLWLLSQ
jgi:maltose alpha-D-glucosyltransferase/alpha-amylase